MEYTKIKLPKDSKGKTINIGDTVAVALTDTETNETFSTYRGKLVLHKYALCLRVRKNKQTYMIPLTELENETLTLIKKANK